MIGWYLRVHTSLQYEWEGLVLYVIQNILFLALYCGERGRPLQIIHSTIYSSHVVPLSPPTWWSCPTWHTWYSTRHSYTSFVNFSSCILLTCSVSLYFLSPSTPHRSTCHLLPHSSVIPDTHRLLSLSFYTLSPQQQSSDSSSQLAAL